MSELSAALERTWRRVAMLVAPGMVSATDDSGDVQRAQVRLRGSAEVRDDTPRLGEYGFASRPHPGADAVVLCVLGDRSGAVVVATGDRRYRLSLAEGEVAIHDDLGQAVHLTRTGIVIAAPQGLSIAGDVSVTGTVTATGEGTFAGHTVGKHTHADPQGGSTGTPTG